MSTEKFPLRVSIYPCILCIHSFPVNGTVEGEVTLTADSSTISFTSIATSDDGIYSCSANTTSGGYDAAIITVEVISK